MESAGLVKDTALRIVAIVGACDDVEYVKHIVMCVTKGIQQWADKHDCSQVINEFFEVADLQFDAPNKDGLAPFYESYYCIPDVEMTLMVNPTLNAVKSEVVRLMSVPAKNRLVVFGGHSIDVNAGWWLQDGIYAVEDFQFGLNDQKLSIGVPKPEHITLTISCVSAQLWKGKSDLTASSSLNLTLLDPFETNMADAHSQELNGATPSQTATVGKGLQHFGEYLEDFINDQVDNIFTQLQPPPHVGYVKIRKPSVYIFPAGNGDSMFFAVNGFNVLVNGGSLASPWFWSLTRHLETVDCMIATHLGTDCLAGINSFLLRKLQEKQIRLPMDNTSDEHKILEACLESPNLGSFYMNIPEKYSETALRKHSNDGEELEGANTEQDAAKHLSIKTVNVVQDTLRLSKRLGLNITPLTRNQTPEPITVYFKVWLGKLDIYVLSPDENCPEIKYIREKWGNNGKISDTAKTGVTVGSQEESKALMSDLASICCLFVWQPASPNEKIVRVLFPGNASQDKILQGLEKMKNCSFLSMPAPTPALLNKQKAAPSPVKPPRSATATKTGVHTKTPSHSAKSTSQASNKTSSIHSKPATTSTANGSSSKTSKPSAAVPKKTPGAKKTASPDSVRAKREAATGFVKPAGKRTKPEKTTEAGSAAAKPKPTTSKPKTGPVHAKAEARVHAKQAASKVTTTKTTDTKMKSGSKNTTKPTKPLASKQPGTKKPAGPISIKGGFSSNKDKSTKEKKKEDTKKNEEESEKPPLTPPEDLTGAFTSLKEEGKVEGVIESKDLPKRPSPEGQDGRDQGQFVDVAHVSAEIDAPKQAVLYAKQDPVTETSLTEEKADNVAEYLAVRDNHFGEKSNEDVVADNPADYIATEESETLSEKKTEEPKVDILPSQEIPVVDAELPGDVSSEYALIEDIQDENQTTPPVKEKDEVCPPIEDPTKHGSVVDDFEIVSYEQEPNAPDLKEEVETKDIKGQGDEEVLLVKHQVNDENEPQTASKTESFDILAATQANETNKPDEDQFSGENDNLLEKELEVAENEDNIVDDHLHKNQETNEDAQKIDLNDEKDATQLEEETLATKHDLYVTGPEEFNEDVDQSEKNDGEYFQKVNNEDILQDDIQPDILQSMEEQVNVEIKKKNDEQPALEESGLQLEEQVPGQPDLLEGYLDLKASHQAEIGDDPHEKLDEDSDNVDDESPQHFDSGEQNGLSSPDLKLNERENLANASLSSVECARDYENQVTFDADVPVVIPEMKQENYEAYDEDYYPDDDDESNGKYGNKEWHPTPYPSDPQSMITDTSPTSELGSYDAQGTDAGMSDVMDNAAHHLDIQAHDINKAVEDIAMSDTPISSGPSTPTEHADLVIDSGDNMAMGDNANYVVVEQKPADENELRGSDSDFGISLTPTSTSKPAVIESPLSTAELDSAYNIPSMGGSISTGIITETDDMKTSDLHPESHALSSIPDFQSIILPDDQEQLPAVIGELDDNGNQSQLVDETDGWEKEMQGLAGKYQDTAPTSAWSDGKDVGNCEENFHSEEKVEETERHESPAPQAITSAPAQETWASKLPEIGVDQFDGGMGSLHASDNIPPTEASQSQSDLLTTDFDRAPIMSLSDSVFDRFLEHGKSPQVAEPKDRSPNLFDEESLLVDVGDHGMDDLHSSTDRPEVDQASFHGNPFASEFSANQVREGQLDFDEEFVPVRKNEPMMAQDKGRPVKPTKAKPNKSATGSKKSDSHPFYVDLTYVPRHCNKNFVNAEFFKRVRARYYVVSGMDASQDEPSLDVLDALLHAKKTWEIPSTQTPGQDGMNVTVIPTHNSSTLVQWYDKQHREMQAENIHLLSSSNKVLLHDETVDACKIEF